VPGFSPLDEELALLPGQLSPVLQEAVVRLGSWIPFERVPAEFDFFTRSTVSVETARRLTETVGAALVAADAEAVVRLEHTLPEPPAGPAVQQLSADGSMVPLVHGDWTEAKMLAVGTVAGGTEVHASEISYFARCTDAATFGRLSTLETHRRGTATAGTVVAITDGATWLQEFIALHRPDAIRILDFPHAVEHLTQVAYARFGEASLGATAWLDQQCHELKHGEPHRVLAAVAALTMPDAAATDLRDAVYAYLAKRRDQIRYAEFQATGYPIGDGMVESANKLVIEQRLKGSGMHWARANVDPMLAVRTMVCNDRWAETWPQCGVTRRRQARARRRDAHVRRQIPPPTPTPAPSPPPIVQPAAAPPRRAPLVVNGTPTAQHPWRHFHLPGSPDFRQPAKK
jgi:hypothetical protein